MIAMQIVVHAVQQFFVIHVKIMLIEMFLIFVNAIMDVVLLEVLALVINYYSKYTIKKKIIKSIFSLKNKKLFIILFIQYKIS